MLKKSFIVFLFLTSLVYSQDKSEFFPDDLTIQPFAANTLEPKLGFSFRLSKNELDLDIGNSIDLFRRELIENQTVSIGGDLFTYTLLRGEKDFHFPVDAVDYLFGINFCYKKVEENNEYGIRTRISHISAHFTDGHYDGTTQQWKDRLNPRVYSREFVEIMTYYKLCDLRFYFGFTYLFHVDPKWIKKDNYQFGFDYYLTRHQLGLFVPFIGYDLKLIHLDKYTANNSFIAGIKFGKPNGKGLSLYYNYYNGKSFHGEYFDINKNYSAIGINLDL